MIFQKKSIINFNANLSSTEWMEVFRARTACPEEEPDLIDKVMNIFLPDFMRNCEDMLRSEGGQYLTGEKVELINFNYKTSINNTLISDDLC